MEDVDVERWGLEILPFQPAPSPQDDPSPRQSPAVSTGSDKSGVSRAETQSTKREGTSPLQTSVDGFLYVSASLDQKGTIILLQPDVGVDDEENTTTSEQVAAREKFAGPSKKRQQQKMTAWTTVQSKLFDPGG